MVQSFMHMGTAFFFEVDGGVTMWQQTVKMHLKRRWTRINQLSASTIIWNEQSPSDSGMRSMDGTLVFTMTYTRRLFLTIV